VVNLAGQPGGAQPLAAHCLCGATAGRLGPPSAPDRPALSLVPQAVRTFSTCSSRREGLGECRWFRRCRRLGRAMRFQVLDRAADTAL
jgi:hypothetical protein